MSEYKNKTTVQKAVDNVLEWIEFFVMSVFVVILIFTFLFKVVAVEGKSMMATLFDGDLLVVTHILYTPENGDIIVLQSDALEKIIVKRVVAVGGQTVEIDYNNNNVSVDGAILSENEYIKEKIMYDDKVNFDQKYYDSQNEKYIYTVPDNCVFVMGDNRNNSSDSRTFGCVNTDAILGKVSFRFSSSYGDLGFIE